MGGYALTMILWWPVALLISYVIAHPSRWGLALFGILVAGMCTFALVRYVIRFAKRLSAVRAAVRSLESIYEGADDSTIARHAYARFGTALGMHDLVTLRERLGRPLPGLWLAFDTNPDDRVWPERGEVVFDMSDVAKGNLHVAEPATNVWHHGEVFRSPPVWRLFREEIRSMIRPSVLIIIGCLSVFAILFCVVYAPHLTPAPFAGIAPYLACAPLALIASLIVLRFGGSWRIDPRLVRITPNGVRVGWGHNNPSRVELPTDDTLCVAMVEPSSSLCSIVLVPGAGAMHRAGERDDAVLRIAPTVEAMTTPWGDAIAPHLLDVR